MRKGMAGRQRSENGGSDNDGSVCNDPRSAHLRENGPSASDMISPIGRTFVHDSLVGGLSAAAAAAAAAYILWGRRSPPSHPGGGRGGVLGWILSRGGGAVAPWRDQEKSAADTAASAAALAENELRRQLMDVRSSLQRIERALPESESRLGGRLQEQERQISKGLADQYAQLRDGLETVRSVGESLARATGKIDDLSAVFHSPRARGALGEAQLECIVRDVFPPGVYEFQKRLSNGSRPDCVLRLPLPIGMVVIDAKFPLDAFRGQPRADHGAEGEGVAGSRISPEVDDGEARKKLAAHLRGHVRAVASKYILPGETADYAVLFLPSEGVFAQVVECHGPVVTEAFRSNVWITSPTTLMAMLTTMKAAVRDVAVSAHARTIMAEVRAMEADIDRLRRRSEDVERSFEKARESLRQMNVSAEKISRRRQNLALLSDEEKVNTDESKS